MLDSGSTGHVSKVGVTGELGQDQALAHGFFVFTLLLHHHFLLPTLFRHRSFDHFLSLLTPHYLSQRLRIKVFYYLIHQV